MKTIDTSAVDRLNWLDFYVLEEANGCSVKALTDELASETKNCGTGSGGFTAGNSCSSGGGSVSDTKNLGSRDTKPSEAIDRTIAMQEHFAGMSNKVFIKEAGALLESTGMSAEDAKSFTAGLNRSISGKYATTTAGFQRDVLAGLGEDYTQRALESSVRGIVAGILLHKEITGYDSSDTIITNIGDTLTGVRDPQQSILMSIENDKSPKYGGAFGAMGDRASNKENPYRPIMIFCPGDIASTENRLLSSPVQTLESPESRQFIGKAWTLDAGLNRLGMISDPEVQKEYAAKMGYVGDLKALSKLTSTPEGRTFLVGTHTVLHEMGHLEHWRATVEREKAAIPNFNPRLDRNALFVASLRKWRNMSEKPGNKSLVMSQYGKKSELETVAEAYSGFALGHTFDDKVRGEYTRLGGGKRKPAKSKKP